MKLRLSKSRPVGLRLGRLMMPALVSLSLSVVGCAHQQGSQEHDELDEQQRTIERLEARLEEVERTNGRLNVRIEELEEQMFLLQDMTESNRLALKRRSYQRRQGRSQRAEAPDPPPESYYDEDDSPYGWDAQNEKRRSRRNVTRIPLSDQQSGAARRGQRYDDSRSDERRRSDSDSRADERRREANAEQADEEEAEELVISEEDFRRFSGESSSSRSDDSGPATRERQARAKAQPPVTDEKLGGKEAKGDKKDSKKKESEVEKASQKSDGKPLDMYKAALSDYRDGNYRQALEGFRTFLNSRPNPNYIDNALYWIGECNYGLGDYETATDYFKRVLDEQPDGNKVPDAMLKMSMAFERLGNADRTRELLEKLTERYPSTNAARLGEEKLSDLDN